MRTFSRHASITKLPSSTNSNHQQQHNTSTFSNQQNQRQLQLQPHRSTRTKMKLGRRPLNHSSTRRHARAPPRPRRSSPRRCTQHHASTALSSTTTTQPLPWRTCQQAHHQPHAAPPEDFPGRPLPVGPRLRRLHSVSYSFSCAGRRF